MKKHMNVGERIRFFRLSKGMSQEMLALEANINTAFVGHLERGLKSPTVNTLEKIVAALGITMEQLFSQQLLENDENVNEGRKLAKARIDYIVSGLTAKEMEQLATIISEIVKFKSE